MTQLLSWTTIFLFLLGCSDASEPLPKAPDVLLEEATLAAIVIDLEIVESHYQFLYSHPDRYKTALDSASHFVFEKHGTTRAVFESSYDYYAHDIDQLFSMYELMLDTINLKIAR